MSLDRRKFLKITSAAALGMMPGCGTADTLFGVSRTGPVPTTGVGNVVLLFGNIGESWGLTRRKNGLDSEIFVSYGTPKEKIPGVIAHEYAHAAGINEHLPNSSCVLYHVAIRNLDYPPCPQELEMMKAKYDDGIKIYTATQSQELIEPGKLARTWWNTNINGEMFA